MGIVSGNSVCAELDPHAAYWDCGIDAVPVRTGAASVMHCADLSDALTHLGVALPLQGAVLDVGCGTGRLAQLCDGAYFGADISRDGVAYARRAGLSARLLTGYAPAAVHGQWVVDTVCCLSVFTHIDADERRDYLRAFASTGARLLIVDVIPGNGAGDVPLWTTAIDGFESELAAQGWRATAVYERTSPDHVTHRYYRCER